MCQLVVILALLSGTALRAEDCPAIPDHSGEIARLITEVQKAPDELTARALTDQMWRIWTLAPDARAQEMLDRGMALRESYDYVGAVEAFDDLVAYCPAYAEGYNQRAFIGFLREDYATALDDLERALALDADHIPAMTGQALTLMNLGRVEAAQEILRKALKLHPWLPERHMLIEPAGTDL